MHYLKKEIDTGKERTWKGENLDMISNDKIHE